MNKIEANDLIWVRSTRSYEWRS